MKKLNRMFSLCMALILLLTMTLVSNAKLTPEEEFMKLMATGQKLRQYHQRAEMSFNVTSELDDLSMKFMSDLYNAITVNYDIIKKGDQLQGSFAYNYEKERLLTVEFYMDDEMITLSIPALHNKTFYLRWDEIGQLVKNIDKTAQVPNINIEDYKALFNVKKSKEFNLIDKLKYYNQIKDFLSGKVTKEKKTETLKITYKDKVKDYKCNVYSLDVGTMDLMELYVTLAKTVIDDKEVKDFIIAKYSELISIALKNEDYKELGMKKVELTVSRLEFPDNYDAAVLALKQGIQQYEVLLQTMENMMNSNLQMKVYVDKNDKKVRRTEAISKSVTEYEGQVIMSIESSVKTTMISYTGITVVKPELKKEDSVNIATITAETISTLMGEIQGQVMSTMTTNPAAQKLMNKVTEFQVKQMEQRKLYEEQLMKELESNEYDFELDVDGEQEKEEKTEK